MSRTNFLLFVWALGTKYIFKRYARKRFFQHYRCRYPAIPLPPFLLSPFPLPFLSLPLLGHSKNLVASQDYISVGIMWPKISSGPARPFSSPGRHYAIRSYVSRRRVYAGIDLCPRVKTRGLPFSRREGYRRARNALTHGFLSLQSGSIAQPSWNTEIGTDSNWKSLVSSLKSPPGLYKFAESRGHIVHTSVLRIPPPSGVPNRNHGSRRRRRTN